MSRAVFLASLVIIGPLLAGCVQPLDPAPPGWQRDPETGITWRPLTQDEQEQWNLDEYPRVYVARIPGLIDDLREEDQVIFPVRVNAGFLQADLTFEKEEHYRIEGDRPRDKTTRWFETESPWDSAYMSLPRAFTMEGRDEGWSYHVSTPFAEWEPIDDIAPDDLITRATPPCAEWSAASGNASSACLRYETPEGY